ncbi:MAG TPA: NAD(P)-dependent oxidoreductase [Burkholderiales bacterium]|nr:NAD(P)-dependent oxidoreductase [Burkholderiales bacterium]
MVCRQAERSGSDLASGEELREPGRRMAKSEASMQRIGFIGLGLMGHGMAKNLLKKGHALSFLVHRNRSNLGDLLDLKAEEASSPKELIASSDVVILCVTGTPQVEANVYGANGLLEGCRKGQIVVDTSTAEPASTDRIRADFASKGVRFVDAPLARTPQHAEDGKLNCMVGADPQTLAEVKPVLEKFCENIFHVGGPGSGHKVKLVYNFVAMAHAAICCESLAACARVGISLESFFQLVSAGGANSNMFQMLVPRALKGDLTGLMFTLGNAKKDIDYYQRMVAGASLAGPMGAALHQALVQANALGLGEKFVPSLIEAYERVNGLTVVKR